MRLRIIVLASLVALGLEGCGHVKRKFVLPPAPPAIAKPLPETKIETPPEIAAPLPMVELPSPEMNVAPPPAPAPPKPPVVRTPPVQPATPEVQPPTPVPVVPPVTAPRLGEILTDERRRQYEREFTAFMTEARAAVNRASGRRLNGVQREMLARIRVFLQQAEDAKGNDLPTALQLARRADLLGQDLIKSIR